MWLGKSSFNKLNKERGKIGEALFANPRNAAAGTIRQLDPKIVAERKLDSFIYDVAFKVSPRKFGPKVRPRNTKRRTRILQELGFKVNKNFKLCQNIEEVIDFGKSGGKKIKKII